MFVKNKVLLLAIYTQNKRIAHMQSDGKQNKKKKKMAFKIIKLIFVDLILKEMCLRNT